MELENQESNRLRIEFQTEPSGVLGTIDDAVSGAIEIELDNVLSGRASERWLAFLTVRTPSKTDLTAILATVETVEPVFVQQTSAISNTFYVLTFTSGLKPQLTITLLEHNAIPHRITVKDQRMSVIATVTSWQALKTLAEKIERQHQSFELIGVTETTEMTFPLGGSMLKYNLQGKLTSDQLLLIETAYQCGHFEVPQQATAEEVAQELNISQSTLSEQLRKAQNAVWDVIFGDRT